MSGSLLSGSALRAALENGKVFKDETWTTASSRAAGYDLRLASDRLVVPGRDGGIVVHQPGEQGATEVLLAPGDTAFISTMERMQFDWDIAGNVGAKFSLAARGLLVLTGLSVDPGFGRELQDAGGWAPAADQRLHFVVANVGPDTIALRPGDTVAFLQLFEVEEVQESDRSVVPSRGYDLFRGEYFEGGRVPSTAGLAYFRNVAEVLEKANESLEAAELQAKEVEKVRAELDIVQSGSNFVVTFGIYLVTITILGVTLTLLLDVLNDFPKDPGLALVIGSIAGGAVLIAATVAGVFVALKRLATGPSLPRSNKPNKKNA